MPLERPYIGVTGVSHPAEASQLSHVFAERLAPESSHQGMIGVLINQRTLEGQLPDKPEKYPPFVDLYSILEAVQGRVPNAIHYSTTDQATLVGQMEKLLGLSGIYGADLARTIQFNMKWPRIDQLRRVRDRFPEIKIILQLGWRILRGEERDEIVDKLGEYQGVANYVLIDPSGGKGLPINEKKVAPLYRLITHSLPMGVVAAGGISNRNVREVLTTLTRELATDEFSIDAEAGLRVQQGEGDKLSLDKASSYVRRSASFFDTA